jgi:hypothetical protein
MDCDRIELNSGHLVVALGLELDILGEKPET